MGVQRIKNSILYEMPQNILIKNENDLKCRKTVMTIIAIKHHAVTFLFFFFCHQITRQIVNVYFTKEKNVVLRILRKKNILIQIFTFQIIFYETSKLQVKFISSVFYIHICIQPIVTLFHHTFFVSPSLAITFQNKTRIPGLYFICNFIFINSRKVIFLLLKYFVCYYNLPLNESLNHL